MYYKQESTIAAILRRIRECVSCRSLGVCHRLLSIRIWLCGWIRVGIGGEVGSNSGVCPSAPGIRRYGESGTYMDHYKQAAWSYSFDRQSSHRRPCSPESPAQSSAPADCRTRSSMRRVDHRRSEKAPRQSWVRGCIAPLRARLQYRCRRWRMILRWREG